MAIQSNVINLKYIPTEKFWFEIDNRKTSKWWKGCIISKMVIWFIGLSGAGKSTLAKMTYKTLKEGEKHSLDRWR